MGSTRMSEVTFCVLVFLSTLCLITAIEDLKDDGLELGEQSDRGGVWFGPRLGKRSLQMYDEDKSDTFMKMLEAADSLQYYYDQMPYQMQGDALPKVSKKVIFTPKLGRATNKAGEKKYDKVEFTPRLGRRLREKIPATPPEEDFVIISPMVTNTRQNSYSPRLGRNYKFSPRLGREVYDSYPETQIRVARSINKTKSN